MGEEDLTLFKYLSVGSARVGASGANGGRVKTQKQQWLQKWGIALTVIRE